MLRTLSKGLLLALIFCPPLPFLRLTFGLDPPLAHASTAALYSSNTGRSKYLSVLHAAITFLRKDATLAMTG